MRSLTFIAVVGAAFTIAAADLRAEGHLYVVTCFQEECSKEFLLSAQRGANGEATARIKTVSFFQGYDERSRERARREKPRPPQVTTVKLSCNRTGGYVQYPGASRIPEPDRDPPHATMGAYHLWAAVCERRFPTPGKEMEFQ